MNTSLIIFCVVLLLVGLALAFYKRGKQAFIRESKAAYLAALKSGNKTEALLAGRKYYSELRGGELTLYDEQAIANDLSTINWPYEKHFSFPFIDLTFFLFKK